MSYTNIVFVKLEKRLLNDPRWWTLSEPAQLIYIKLILLAAETYNKIPKNDEILRQALRSRLELQRFRECLVCKSKFRIFSADLKTKRWVGGKFCSRKCFYIWQKGRKKA